MLRITKNRQEAFGWSISRLAREANMHTSTVSSIESGRLRPYPSQVEKLAKALGWEDDPLKLFEEVE